MSDPGLLMVGSLEEANASPRDRVVALFGTPSRPVEAIPITWEQARDVYLDVRVWVGASHSVKPSGYVQAFSLAYDSFLRKGPEGPEKPCNLVKDYEWCILVYKGE